MTGGGVLIQDEAEAKRYASSDLADRHVDPGDLVFLEPCVPIPWPDVRASEDRPCPRVELDPINRGAATVVLSSALRGAASWLPRLIFDCFYGPMSEQDRAAAASRIAQTLFDPEVAESLNPPDQGGAGLLLELLSGR